MCLRLSIRLSLGSISAPNLKQICNSQIQMKRLSWRGKIAIVEGVQIVKRFLFLLLLAGCTQHSNDYPVAEVPIKTAHAQTSIRGSAEDFNIIAGLLKNEIATSLSFLDMADKLVYEKRELGTEISLSDCMLISSVVCPAAGEESSKIYLNKISLKNSSSGSRRPTRPVLG